MNSSQRGVSMVVLVVSIALVIGLIALGYFITMNRNTETTVPDTSQETLQSPAPSTDSAQGEKKSFTLTASDYQFDTTEIRVKKGDTVTLSLTSTDGMHDWVLDGYTDVRTKMLQQGETDTIEFVADKSGTFEYYCSFGSHRQMGMVGTLIVED